MDEVVSVFMEEHYLSRQSKLKTILLIEDDPAIQELLREFLELIGHKVDVVTEASQAVAKTKTRDYDIVISDWTLPGSKNGFELIQHIQTISKDPSKIKFILTSGNPSQYCLAPDERNKIDAFLEKPFKFESLYQVIK